MPRFCSLPPRLALLADLAAPCDTLADIGTDHAHLPVFLLQTEGCRCAMACDVNEGPLRRAQANIEAYGLSDRVSVIQSDGLRSVPDTYDVLVIAGMGGDLISKILLEHPPSCAKKILLQPMTKPEVLRRFLFRHGYSILREFAVSEGEKIYIIFQVSFRPISSFSETDCHIPRAIQPSVDALDYLEHLLNSHQRKLLGLQRAENLNEEAISFEKTLCRDIEALWQTVSRRLYDETH